MPQSLIDLAGLRVGAEEFLSAVLAATEQPIWVVDRDGVIRFANPAAIAGLGYDSTEELVGRHSHETIHHSRPDGRPFPAEDCPMLLPRITGETVSSELDWFFRRDGSMFPVSYVSAPIELLDGRGAVVAFTNIEDRLRAEQAMREHEAAIAAQQASLRRVATLVAGGAASHEVFAAIAREVGQVMGLPLVAVWRYEPDGSAATVVGVWSAHPHPFRPGSRWPLDGPTITARVRDTGRSVRIDDWAKVPGTIAEAARGVGITGAAGAPIIVDGEIWGAMSADSTERAPMPEDVEERLLEFTELIGAVFATTARQDEMARLAEQQAALRRVATLVARDTPPEAVFAAVAREVGEVLGVDATHMGRYDADGTVVSVAQWGTYAGVPVGARYPLEGESVSARVLRTGGPARMNEYEHASGVIAATVRELGIRFSIGVPISVEGSPWGVMIATTKGPSPFPDETESRLQDFTELVAAAISNASAHEKVRALADEQAALRRVATLVAEDVSDSELFAAVVDEVGRLFGSDLAGMLRFEPDDTVTVKGVWREEGERPTVEGRWSLEGDRVVTAIARTGRPAREDAWGDVTGPIAEYLHRRLAIVSSVGSPIVVEGRVWGALFVHSNEKALPANTETRLLDFTELVATAVSNAQARGEVERLAAEQAALRRVATLVAREASEADVFRMVTEEAARVLATEAVGLLRFEPDGTATLVAQSQTPWDPPPLGTRFPLDGENLVVALHRTGEAVRDDSWANASGAVAALADTLGVRSSVAAPVVVEGRVWGTIIATTSQSEPLPAETETRIARFSDLIATAVANANARAEVERLAAEQAALRRVATLIAEDVPASELFDAVACEVGTLLDGDFAGLARFEESSVFPVGAWTAEGEHPPVPPCWEMHEGDPATTIAERREPTRWTDWSDVPGPIAAFIRELGIRTTVGTPIMVKGRVWGALALHSKQTAALPADIEARMGQFTDLVGTAIANAQTRAEVARLATEQAALRRVATLVARDASQEEVFTKIAQEIGQLLGTEEIWMTRYEGDEAGVVVASAGRADAVFRVGYRVPLTSNTAIARVFQTGRQVRIDDYSLESGPLPEQLSAIGVRGVVGTPIRVEGRLWGSIVAGTTNPDPLAPETESRLGQFTELMATAIANANARAEVQRLADEQTALRRVATLVAEGASPAGVFDAVAGEMEALLGADQVALNRVEGGGEILVLAHRGLDVDRTPVGSRVKTEGESATATVLRTGQPARMERYDEADGPLADLARATGLRSSVSAPIVVDGYLWGVITASWKGEYAPPADTEQRMARFAQLLDTAIANAEARAELMASRARLVAASDEARRRFERDLHDGVQQRLVSLSLELRGAEAIAPPEHEELSGQLAHVAEGLAEVLDELRELSRGIHPAILSEAGLGPALKALARRSAVPVQVAVDLEDRLPERVEVAAYYVASEALTNVAKHSQASQARVRVGVRGQRLEMTIDDDGIGGAAPAHGSGLTGLADRVEALGGSIAVSSPPGEGTSLRVVLSLDSQ